VRSVERAARAPRTVSPSLRSCTASDGASSFLSASALRAFASATRLLTSRRARHDRCVRSTSATHDELRAPAPRSLPGVPAAAFTAWVPRRVWAPRGLTGGPGDSRHPNRFGGSESVAPWPSFEGGVRSVWRCLAVRAERGRCLPTAPLAIEPLTSLSPLLRAVRSGPLAFAMPVVPSVRTGRSRRDRRDRRPVTGEGS
jgi:hypothetical protein